MFLPSIKSGVTAGLGDFSESVFVEAQLLACVYLTACLFYREMMTGNGPRGEKPMSPIRDAVF